MQIEKDDFNLTKSSFFEISKFLTSIILAPIAPGFAKKLEI